MSGDVTPIKDALDNPAPAPTMAQAGDARPDSAAAQRPPIDWKSSPVKPLGILSTEDGRQTCFYLDCNAQLVGLEANNRHGINGITALFGSEEWLEEQFPKWSKPVYEGRGSARVLVKPSEIIGWDQSLAAKAMIKECTRKGRYSSTDRKRGRGAHPLEMNGIALHCGDKLYFSELDIEGRFRRFRWEDLGVLGEHVYPADDAIPRPWHEPVGPEAAMMLIGGAPGRDGLRGLFRTWHWKRELLDPRLLLGWVGAALIGGALPWRPNFWLTGGRGTGKSELNGKNKVLHQLLGKGCFRTANTSGAAIRQSLGQATVPVLIDEIEASNDERKVQEVIELARLSSSGDSGHRGGQDHNAREFTISSAFFFSSINIPAMDPQDKSRLAVGQLLPFPNDWPPPPDLAAYNLPVLGRKLLRRMLDGWERLSATKAKYHEALKALGHDGRACDQFGTLLACADVLIHDHDTADGLPDIEDVLQWTDMCHPQRLREVVQEEQEWVSCLNHLMGAPVQARGGDERVALATWIGGALDHAVAPLLAGTGDNKADEKAAGRLADLGLKLVNATFYPEETDENGKVLKDKGARWGTSAFDPAAPGFLAIAPGQQTIGHLFEGKHWKSIYGDVLARFPHAIEAQKVAFGRRRLKAVCVPLYHVLDDDQLPEASREEALKKWLRDECEGAEA